MANQSAVTEVRWWVPGDWNGFFGLFTNVAAQRDRADRPVPVAWCSCPPTSVFGRILPALGIALPIGNLYYAYLAWQLAKKEGRSDVTAMPYGPSVPHMFIVVFVIMLPVYLKTKDPMLAWQAGLAWAFIIGVIVLAGVFVGPWIRTHTPRAAMLGTLAGISIAFISMRPAFQMWEVPWIAFVSLRHRADQLDRERAPAVRAARRPGRRDRRRGARLGRRTSSAGATSCKAEQVSAVASTQFGLHLPIPRRRGVARPARRRAAAGHRDSARHLQLHRGDEQRRERRRRRATTTTCARSSPPTASARSSARCSAARSRRRCTSAIRAGKPWAGASATRSPPAW